MGNLGVALFWGEDMKLKTNDYVDEYIILCSQLCKKAEDYTKEKVAKHNMAMKKIEKLKKHMYLDAQLTESVYSILLNCKDPYVQQTAATDCLLLKIHVDASVKILKSISRCGDRMSAMEAKRTLLIWKGKINPSDPF